MFLFNQGHTKKLDRFAHDKIMYTNFRQSCSLQTINFVKTNTGRHRYSRSWYPRTCVLFFAFSHMTCTTKTICYQHIITRYCIAGWNFSKNLTPANNEERLQQKHHGMLFYVTAFLGNKELGLWSKLKIVDHNEKRKAIQKSITLKFQSKFK